MKKKRRKTYREVDSNRNLKNMENYTVSIDTIKAYAENQQEVAYNS